MELSVINLGFRDYASTLELQRRLWERRVEDCIPDTLLIVEHDHAITLGKSADRKDLLLSADELRRLGIAVHEVERGGECTYHGPGQLVAYPIIKLGNERGVISRFIAGLEEVMLRTLGESGIMGFRKTGAPGVWLGDKKIGSVGITVRKWVSYHGFALNVNTDLSYFRFIRPCGQDWQVMTSVAQVLGREVDFNGVAAAAARLFARVIKNNIRIIAVDDRSIAKAGMAGSTVGI
ncbi:MAG: lipoyl(octanoyl) transferase LipB [Dehalococcoidia bacterium]|nr:lipoyl(octanoyl) transferase LipB [Dehalococcoidia bacterium]